MTGRELIRRLRALGRARGVHVRFDARRGKGSHGRLYFGDRVTTVPDVGRELRAGTLRAVLRDLGLRPEDLEG